MIPNGNDIVVSQGTTSRDFLNRRSEMQVSREDELKLCEPIEKLEKYIISEGYEGYDPFDALMSPIFKLPVFKSNKIIRLGFQQALKRVPVNLRHILGTPKGLNPVTLGLCIQAYARLSQVFKEKLDFYSHQIDYCLQRLVELRSNGYSGSCWGYDFDWEARYARIHAFMPTSVATGIITNALFTNYKLLGSAESLELCTNATKFFLSDLNRAYGDDGSYCFSYSPNDTQVVFNASMKGARLLSQVYSITNEQYLMEEAKKVVSFVMKHQRDDGAWSYSEGDTRTWVDNFHTGYVLDCLDEFIRCTGDTEFLPALQRGFEFYKNSFFLEQGIPKYYQDRTYPIDSTAAAQSILTLCRFGQVKMASDVAGWMIDSMQDSSGYFYYRKHRFSMNRISYMRWSNAWMFLALASLAYHLKDEDNEDLV